MKKILYTMLVALAATFSFTSCEDVPAPYDIPNGGNGGNGGGSGGNTELVGDGTEANPYTVTDIKTNGASGSNVFVKAYIVGFVPDKSIDEAKFTAEGCEAASNVIIAASADETNVNNVMPVQLPVGAVRTGVNLKDNPGNIKQEVVLCGNVEAYFGKTGLKAVVWAKIGGKEFGTKPGTDTPVVGDPKGAGTKEDPFNVAAANKYIKDGGDATVEKYVKGKISELKEFRSEYGSISYYISDDGTTANQFFVYGGNNLGNTKFTKLEDLKVGDEVVICGKLKNFNNTYEFDSKNYLVSLNGKTESGSTGGGEDKPSTEMDKNLAIDGSTVTISNPDVEVGTETIDVVPGDFCKENGEDVTTITLSDGTKITFDANEEKNGPKYYTGKTYSHFRVYKNNSISFDGHKAIAKIVFSCDKNNGADCVGNETATITINGNNITYNNKYTESTGGGVQLRISKITITYAK